MKFNAQPPFFVHAAIVSLIIHSWVVVSENCDGPYGRCAGDQCSEEAPLQCFSALSGEICVREENICDGVCHCFLLPDGCQDELEENCREKRIRTVMKILPYAGVVLAVPVGLTIGYYCCCGGRKKRQNETTDQDNNDSDNVNGQASNHTPTRHRMLSNSTSNQSSRSRSNSNITMGSRPNFYSLPRRERRYRRPDRAYGIGSVSLTDSPQCSLIARSIHSRPGRTQSARNYRRIADERHLGGSLRIPLPSTSHSEQDIEYGRSLADAPPSYSDTCIHSQSDCLTVPRDFWRSLSANTTRPEKEPPPPSYKEVLEENYPMFGSFNEIKCSPPAATLS